ANVIAQRLSELPQVSQTITLSNLVPRDQDAKLKLIDEAADAIDPSLNPKETNPPATDGENIEALTSTADFLSRVAGSEQGPGAGGRGWGRGGCGRALAAGECRSFGA